jgi:hypothetical protein
MRPFFLQDQYRIILRLAAVDDEGKACAAGGMDVDEEIRLLRLARREVIVIVEADLADADAFRVLCEVRRVRRR